jgi:hypothetical protein
MGEGDDGRRRGQTYSCANTGEFAARGKAIFMIFFSLKPHSDSRVEKGFP